MSDLTVIVVTGILWIGIAYGVGFWIGHFRKKRRLKSEVK
jgi:uncharacterized protein YneF (UPF0154 family)